MWNARNPSHPGEILKFYLEELMFSRAKLAKKIGWSANKICDICNGKRGISALMAVQLADALGTSPILWMNAQKTWALDEALKQFGRSIEDYRYDQVE